MFLTLINKYKYIYILENHKEELNPTENFPKIQSHYKGLIAEHLRHEFMWADMKH